MTKIKDLTSEELSRLARTVEFGEGEFATVGKLAYYSMVLDDKPVAGFKYLLPMIAGLPLDGHDILVPAVCEYACSLLQDAEDVEPSESFSRKLILQRYLIGLYTPNSPDLELSPLDSIESFSFDQKKHQDLIQKCTNGTGDLSLAWKAYRWSTGLNAGAIKHKTLGSNVPLEKLLEENDEEFLTTDEFNLFLEQSSITL